MKKIILSITLMCAMCISLFAQNVNVNLRIYKFAHVSIINPLGKSLGANRGDGNLYWFKAGSEWRSFDADGDKISVAYNGPALMQLYKKNGDGKTDKSYSPVAKINIPSGSRDVFVLMIVRNRTADFIPINVSPDKLPKGKVVVMNMTPRTLAIQFGEDRNLLRSRANAVFSRPKLKDKNATAVPVLIAAKVKGKWEISNKTRVEYPENERCILLLFDPSNKDIPNINLRIVTF